MKTNEGAAEMFALNLVIKRRCIYTIKSILKILNSSARAVILDSYLTPHVSLILTPSHAIYLVLLSGTFE